MLNSWFMQMGGWADGRIGGWAGGQVLAPEFYRRVKGGNAEETQS
jgi:hypothetical protein